MQTTWHRDSLVPGRERGECQLCYIVPAIDQPEIQKLSGSPCRHCIGGGCDVYETRPEVCRAAARSRADVKIVLELLLKRLAAFPTTPYVMENSGHDVGT